MGTGSYGWWILLTGALAFVLAWGCPVHAATITVEVIDETGDGVGNPLHSPRALALDTLGNVYVVGFASDNAFKITPGGVIVEIIDETGDGAGHSLDEPGSIAVDAAGNVYVAGFGSDNAFKITPGGVITEIIDATGDGGNPLTSASGIAADSSGNVYVTGFGSDNAFKITPAGSITEIIDDTGDGAGSSLGEPRGVAVDSSGNVYVTGGLSDNAFEITPGGVITEIINATGNTLDEPRGIAVDASGNVYVAGGLSENAFKITAGGVITEIINAAGAGPGQLLSGSSGIAVDAGYNVYLSGRLSDNTFKITPRGTITQIISLTGDGGANPLDGADGIAVNTAGTKVCVAGRDSDNVLQVSPIPVTEIIDATGDGSGNPLNASLGTAVDSSDNVYVAGFSSHNALKIMPDGVITEIIDRTGDGAGHPLSYPTSSAADSSGNVFVAGSNSDNVFKITPGGMITEIIDATGDGTGNVLVEPGDLAVDSSGNVYVTGSYSINAFKITPGGVIVEIIDATGDGAGNVLSAPSAIAVDSQGNVYVAGANSGNAFKITPGGVITEIIDSTGDGAGNPLSFPQSIAADSSGNVYVAGQFTSNVFKITPGGVITEIIDSLCSSRSIAVDSSGNVYMTCQGSSNAFKITPGGVITEIIDSTGDGAGNPLSFPRSKSIAADSSGNVYVLGNESDNAFKIAMVAMDLAVTKTGAGTTPGSSLTYTIVASNSGPIADPSATLTDTFPTDLTCTYTSVAAGGATGNTASGSGDLAETLSMPASSSVTYTVTCGIASSAAGALSNTATIIPSLTDATPGDNSATVDTELDPAADLSITKTDGVTSAVPGQTLTYIIMATNSGPCDDPAVMLTDSFTADLICTYTSAVAGGATGNTASGSGNLSETLSMPDGSSVTYTVTCTIDPGATGTLSNTATVSGSVTDPTSGNDSSTDDDTALSPQADLGITKDDGVTSAVPGETLTYTIVATNNGPSDDPSVSVTDTFPTDLTCTYTSVASGGATGNTSSGSEDLAETLSLPDGGSVNYTVDCTIDESATGTLSNKATVSASVTDPVSDNDSDTDNDTALGAVADLSITKDDGETEVTPGGTLEYTITVDNSGPSDVTGAKVTDTFPTDITSVIWNCTTSGGAGCVAGGGGDIDETVDLPVNGQVVFVATGIVDGDTASGTTLSNTVKVAAPDGVTDADTFNNTAVDNDTVVTPTVDLRITVNDGVATAVPGETVTYTVTASNESTLLIVTPTLHGLPALAVLPLKSTGVTDATVGDEFPAELDCEWSCVPLGGATCTAGPVPGDILDSVDLPPGASAVYTATCTVASSATGTLSNTATVGVPFGTTEIDDSDNTATDNDTLTPEADLWITKDDELTAAVPGGTVTYTVVAANAGPSDASGVNVEDMFPDSLSCLWSCAATGGATCVTSQTAGDIDDDFDLPAGATATYTAICSIASSATGTLANTAEITAPATGLTEIDPNNNSASDLDTVLIPQADLEITKTDEVTSAAPGEALTYTLTVSNPSGPSHVSGATVTDTLPDQIASCTWTCADTGGASCSAASSGQGDLSGTVNLPVGSSVTYTGDCTIDAAASGTIQNTATVDVPSGTADSDTTNNSASDVDTELAAEATLEITNDDGVTSAVPGTSLTYTIAVSNPGGPSDVTDATVSDTFPSSLTCVSTCSATGGASCAAGQIAGDLSEAVELPVGGEVTYTATCDIDPAATGTLANTATVASDTVGSASASDFDTDLAPEADLTISKSDGLTSVAPGGSVTYTIRVSNPDGPSDAASATVSDTFTSPLESCVWTCTASEGGTCTPGQVSGDLADTASLPVGAEATYTATCAVASDASGTLSNTATVSASVDSNTDNNSATDLDTLVEASADLGVTKTDGVTSATPGESVTYTIVASNAAGPDDVTDATVTDVFPSSLDCLWTCEAADGASCTPGQVAGDIDDVIDLPVGATATYTAVCDIDAAATGSLSNTATVEAPAGVDDTDSSNNSASDVDTELVEQPADLELTLTDSPDPVTAGGELVFDLVVTNNGPGAATGIVLTVELPAGVTSDLAAVEIFSDGFESGDTTAWSVATEGSGASRCTGDDGTVTCSVGSLASGESTTVSLTVTVESGITGILTTTASLEADQEDLDESNNSASATTTVLAGQVDLSVSLSDSPDPVAAGGTLTYTAVVSNSGPAAATGVVLESHLPPEVALLSATPDQGSCTPGAPLECDLGNLTSSASVSVTIEVTVSPTAVGGLTHPAVVSGNETDSDMSNNEDTETTQISSGLGAGDFYPLMLR